jgi:hypothetical protein
MDDLSQDFEVLAERADDCGALWAARTLRRHTAAKRDLPEEWPGTLDEARGLVATFAGRTGFTDRERLAKIVLYAAEWTWSESVHGVVSSYARAG